MKDSDYFSIIDSSIENFRANESHRRKIKVSKKPHSDWLIYEWRQLSWNENDTNYSIEIYPNFNDKEEIVSWNLGAAAWYDSKNKRYHLGRLFTKEKTLFFITNSIDELFTESFDFLNSISKNDIPFAVDLKQSSGYSA